MNSNKQNSLALFWTVSVFLLLWNIFGLLSFLGHTFTPDEMLKSMSKDEIDLLNSYPTWTYFVFGIAVFTGILGSIGLLARKKWAKTVFQISLLAVVIQMIHNVFFSGSLDVYGVAQTITMPILVVLMGIVALIFSGRAIAKGWIR